MDTLADTVTLEVTGLPKDLASRLAARARACGRTVSDYMRGLIEQDLAESQPGPRSTLDEILAPVHEEFARSGMTEEELDAMVEEIRDEIWQEKQAARGQTHAR